MNIDDPYGIKDTILKERRLLNKYESVKNNKLFIVGTGVELPKYGGIRECDKLHFFIGPTGLSYEFINLIDRLVCQNNLKRITIYIPRRYYKDITSEIYEKYRNIFFNDNYRKIVMIRGMKRPVVFKTDNSNGALVVWFYNTFNYFDFNYGKYEYNGRAVIC